MGDIETAEAWQQQSVAVRQEVGDEWGRRFTDWGLARVHLARGDLAAADQEQRPLETIISDKESSLGLRAIRQWGCPNR